MHLSQLLFNEKEAKKVMIDEDEKGMFYDDVRFFQELYHSESSHIVTFVYNPNYFWSFTLDIFT